MPSPSSVLTHRKDKILSYIQETSLTFGISFGGVMGLDIAVKDLSRAIDTVSTFGALLHGASAGTLVGFTAVYAPPVLTKLYFQARESGDISIPSLLEVHQNKPFRLAGIATGLAMGLTLTWNAISAADNKPINYAPLVEAGQQIISSLGNIGAQAGTGYGIYTTYTTANLHALPAATPDSL